MTILRGHRALERASWMNCLRENFMGPDWQKWVRAHEKSIVDGGAPLGKTKRVTRDGIADIRNNLAAYTVVGAESYDEAAKMFLDHPHFTIFPGDGVEIMECLPLPQR